MTALSRRRFLAAGAAAGMRLRAQEPTFTSDVNVVNLLATVRDKRSAIVGNLERDDFVLLENGRPQTIRYFTRESDLPLTIGLMVDTSMSQERLKNAERGASARFLDQVLRENRDQVFITLFDLNVHTIQPLTGSRRVLDEALPKIDTPTRAQVNSQAGGGTLLFDALVDAARDPMKNLTGRKALIVLSDGGDNGSEQTLESAVQEAQRAETLLYTILYSDGGFGPGGGKRIMEALARETGGRFFEVSRKLSIDQVFAVIQEDLRSQYSIGFVSDRPAALSEFRRVQLSTRRAGLTAHARDRYWAGPRN